eukprot:10086830-Lingulodinium_polyedra.AAC.1
MSGGPRRRSSTLRWCSASVVKLSGDVANGTLAWAREAGVFHVDVWATCSYVKGQGTPYARAK